MSLSLSVDDIFKSNASDSTVEHKRLLLSSSKQDFGINEIYQLYLKNVNYSSDFSEFIEKTMKIFNETTSSSLPNILDYNSSGNSDELDSGDGDGSMMRPSDSDNKFNVANSQAILILLTVIYVIIFVTGVLGNTVTCIVIARNRGMHTAVNYYLFSLAVSDLLLLLSGKKKIESGTHTRDMELQTNPHER